jgi:hypothetical protein
MWIEFQVKAFTRSPRLLRERALHAAGNEIAAAVTRSHPAMRKLPVYAKYAVT